MTLEQLQAELDQRDHGVLESGSHNPGETFCALEFESQVRGREWSDQPVTLPDLRPLNDGRWSSTKTRTAHLLPVMVALWDWSTWSSRRRKAWVSYVILETVRMIVADMPQLPDAIRHKCRGVSTLDAAARAAAYAAAYAAANAAYAANAADAAYAAYAAYAAADAADAAYAAARAAARAAYAARAAADAADAAYAANAARAAADAADAANTAARAESVLIRACQIWIDGAHHTEQE